MRNDELAKHPCLLYNAQHKKLTSEHLMQQKSKSTNGIFLLIHGAWHASWCWERVAKQLIGLEHQVITPDLPGHGANIRASHTVNFNDYVSSTIELIQQQSEPVTLVGHSMGGLIISQVAEHIPDRVRELVYVAAYIPQHQQSLLSIAEESASREVSPLLIIDQQKQEIRLNSTPEISNIFFNRCLREDADYASKKLQVQPLQPFTQSVKLSKHFDSVSKKSLVCRFDRAIYFNDQLRMSKQVTDNIVYLDADHAAYYSGAGEIAQALMTASCKVL